MSIAHREQGHFPEDEQPHHGACRVVESFQAHPPRSLTGIGRLQPDCPVVIVHRLGLASLRGADLACDLHGENAEAITSN
jgi:hypothetical protein